MAEEPTITKSAVPPSRPPASGQGKGQAPEPPKEKKGGISETFSGLRVSLVPKELLGQEGPDLKLRLLIVAMILILETGGILGGYYFLNKATEKKEIQKAVLVQQFETVKLEAEKQEQEMRDAIVFSQQLEAATSALDKHVYATEVIDFLEASTLAKIKYDRIQINLVTGIVGLDVKAPKFRALAEQSVYFRNLDNFIISLGQSFYMGIFIFDIIYLIGGKKEIESKPKPLYKHWIGKLETIERKHQNRNNK